MPRERKARIINFFVHHPDLTYYCTRFTDLVGVCVVVGIMMAPVFIWYYKD